MEPTVLAGPVEFSPADIALILGIIVGAFVAVMAPGWAFVAVAACRRRTTARPGNAWGAALGGAVGGLSVCLATCGLVGSLLADSGPSAMVVAVLASWGACWGLAWWLSPGSRSRGTSSTRDTGSPHDTEDASAGNQGWGR